MKIHRQHRLKRNFSSLVTDNNLLKHKTLLLIPLTLHVILAMSLMNISLSLTKSLHCLNLVILTFVNFVVSILILILKQLVPSIVHSKLDYCNSLYFNLPKSQINCFQNSLARVVVKAPKSCHISPVLKSLHWLKINERIDYKLLSYIQGFHYDAALLPGQY